MEDSEFYEGLSIDDLKVLCDEREIKYSRTATEQTLIKFLIHYERKSRESKEKERESKEKERESKEKEREKELELE